MVWGGISGMDKAAHIAMECNITAQQYITDVLKPVIVPRTENHGHDLILMDDNATPHHARVTNKHLEAEGVTQMDGPACSPDQNPIEHAWGYLGRALSRRMLGNEWIKQVRQYLFEEWDNIPQRIIKKLITNMRRRCQAVIDNQGSHTKY